MNFQYDHYEYAKALLVLEEQRHALQFRFALAATNSKKNLLQRVTRLFNSGPQTNFSSLQKFKFISLCFLLLTVIFTVLPQMTDKPANYKKKVFSKREKLNLAKFYRLPKEIALKNILKSLPIKSVDQKGPVATNNKTKKQPANNTTVDYVNAFINEELLNPPVSQVEPIISQIVEKETENSKYLVKIEEEQSGKKQKNTYYFELNSKNGNAAIKPLMMLNKFKASVKKTPLGNLRDSLNTLSRSNTKKKITS